ncbi:Hypothetical_protein [Hexamita inflata]|uniref:Hypothetical_protein n=1 Tax=Hexamita inflata TaxID=28002 RepID=A0AA86PFT5_9EUKA|nr:Hypothetical protein HINF_LOCUS22597 [Hexamita inflata]
MKLRQKEMMFIESSNSIFDQFHLCSVSANSRRQYYVDSFDKQQQQKSSPNNITYKLPSKEKRPQKIANKTTNLQHYSQVQTLTKQETTQTQQHATPLLNQRLLSTKRSPKQTPLARKSQRRDFEEV